MIDANQVPDRFKSLVAREIIFPYIVGSTIRGSHSGIIIAGFGHKELFPTLVAYRIDGMIFGRLKFGRDEVIDIDRKGRRAAVLPFAQREMVDRFIYGFDDPIQREIATFCEANLDEFAQKVKT